MRLTKQASKRKRRKDVVPALGAVGVSLSLAGGGSASAAVADLPQKDAATSPEIILSEEEISDVNLGTFYVFDKETAGTPRLGEKFARACGGCGGGRGCSAAVAAAAVFLGERAASANVFALAPLRRGFSASSPSPSPTPRTRHPANENQASPKSRSPAFRKGHRIRRSDASMRPQVK
jgi:hypothetical protein